MNLIILFGAVCNLVLTRVYKTSIQYIAAIINIHWTNDPGLMMNKSTSYISYLTSVFLYKNWRLLFWGVIAFIPILWPDISWSSVSAKTNNHYLPKGSTKAFGLELDLISTSLHFTFNLSTVFNFTLEANKMICFPQMNRHFIFYH